MPRASRSAGEHVHGGGPCPPEYEVPFSVRSSCIFYKEYQEYERSIKLSNSEQSVERPLLTLQQLLPESVRMSLAVTLFKGTRGAELAEDDLKEGLAQHGECWTDADVIPARSISWWSSSWPWPQSPPHCIAWMRSIGGYGL